MSEFKWTQVAMSTTVSKDEWSTHLVRLPDPWWRRVLVRLRLAKPRYRNATLMDLFYGDNAPPPPPKLRGLSDRY